MKIAKELDAADEYIELDRSNAKEQWAQIKKDNPYGFDVVVEGRSGQCERGHALLTCISSNWRRVHCERCHQLRQARRYSFGVRIL